MPASPEESGDTVDGASNPLMTARARPKLSKPPGQPGTAIKAKGSEGDTRQSRTSIGSRDVIDQRSSSQQRNAKRCGPQKRAKSVSSSRLEQKSDNPETTSHGRKTPPPIVRPRDLPSPKVQGNSNTPTGSADTASHLVERLEKLALQHEALMATHSTLTEQHSALLIRHETVLTALEQLVSRGVSVREASDYGADGEKARSSPSSKVRGSTTSDSNGSNGSRLRRIGSAPAGNKQNSASDTKAAPIPSQHCASFIRPPSLPSTNQSNNKSGSISPGRVLPRRSGTPNKGGSSGNNGTAGASSNHAAAAGHSLRVVVRKRPAAEDEVDCVEVLENGGILVHEDKVSEQQKHGERNTQ